MPKISSRRKNKSRSRNKSRSPLNSMKVPNLLKNQVSLWIVSIIAAAMIINYLVKSQFTSLIVLLAVGFLSTMFTKNMVITLLVAVGVTLLFRQFGGVREGLKEGAESLEGEEESKKRIKPVNLPNSKSIGPKEPKEPVNLPNSKSIGLTEKDCEIRAKSGECFKNPVWMYDVCNNECDKQNNILMNIITPQSTSTNLSETTSSANSITKPKNSDTSTITMNDGNKFNTSSNNTVAYGKPKKN